ncbi:hypothetical protein BH10PSE12_BH10PSE12_05250 [soil metagenome]
MLPVEAAVVPVDKALSMLSRALSIAVWSTLEMLPVETADAMR